jgi:nitrogen fixation protein FixH
MNKPFIITVLGLLISSLGLGCQPPPGANPDALTLQIESPKSETSWGFTSIHGTVSSPEASVTINGDGVPVAADGSFTLDYIPLSEGRNDFYIVATLGDDEVSRLVTVTYTLNLRASLNLNLEPGRDWFTESPVEIGGRVSDPRAEVTVNVVKADVGRDGFFSVTLELTEGTNPLTVVAKLNDQTYKETEEAFYVPLVPLTLDIETPEDGCESAIDLVKVAGTVSDPEAGVFVNDTPALVTAAGVFSAYVELAVGENHIEAVATRGEDRETDEVSITYQPTETPSGVISLRIDSPQAKATYKVNVLPVTGTVSDPAAVVVVDGMEAQVAGDGTFQGLAVLKEGENSIEINAIKGTLRATENVSVSFDPALVIYLDYPDTKSTDYTKEPLMVTGRVNKPGAEVTINGQEATVSTDGSFTAWIDIGGSDWLTAVATFGEERDEAREALSPIPGYSIFSAAHLEYEPEVTLKAGDTRRLALTLETRKDGPGSFSGRLFYVGGEYEILPLPMPEGLDVYLEPPQFTAYSNTIYNFNLVLVATAELPQDIYYLHFYNHLENGFYSDGYIRVTVRS